MSRSSIDVRHSLLSLIKLHALEDVLGSQSVKEMSSITVEMPDKNFTIFKKMCIAYLFSSICNSPHWEHLSLLLLYWQGKFCKILSLNLKSGILIEFS